MKAAVKAHGSERGGLTGLALRSGAPKSITSRWINEPGARVDKAAQRIKVQIGITQAKLPLQYA